MYVPDTLPLGIVNTGSGEKLEMDEQPVDSDDDGVPGDFCSHAKLVEAQVPAKNT
jgi:hypothetical protein